jgi:alpha-L-fucosidase 2
LRDGVVGPVTLESEKGRECRLHNPWPGRVVRVRNAALPESRVSGSVLRIPTRPGDRLVLEPVE